MNGAPLAVQHATADDNRAIRRKEYVWRLMIIAVVGFCVWNVRDFRWYLMWPSAGIIAKGLGVSILLSLISISAGALIAIPLTVARVYGPPGIRHIAIAIIEIVRATPELMVIFWVFFMVPQITGTPISGWATAVWAMTIIASAYLAEVLRGGLYSVPKGQWEAGFSSGLRSYQTFFRIILPQAVRNMTPAFLGQTVMLFKTTSLVYIVGVIEFFKATQIVNNNVYAPYATYTLLAVGYFLCCSAISYAIRRVDPKYQLLD